MDIRKLTPTLSVCPQISADDIAEIARLGYKTVICNRPEGESEDQPAMDAISAACQQAGLTWHYQPVISGQVTDADADQFGQLLSEAQQPVFAYCRTGTRCTCLWALSQAANTPVDTLVETAKAAGYDLNGLRPRLEARSR